MPFMYGAVAGNNTSGSSDLPGSACLEGVMQFLYSSSILKHGQSVLQGNDTAFKG